MRSASSGTWSRSRSRPSARWAAGEDLLRYGLAALLRAVVEAPDAFRVIYLQRNGENRVERGREHWEQRIGEVLSAWTQLPERETTLQGRMLVALAELAFRVQLDEPGVWEPDALAAYLAGVAIHGLLDGQRRLERSGNARGDRVARGVVGVLGSRPEEPTQAVLGIARNDVAVQMCHGLTDDVVHGDEGPLRVHRLRDRDGEPLGQREERGDRVGRQVGQRLDVRARDQQRVALEQRPPVEERDVIGILVDDRRRQRLVDDLAEDAVGHAPQL